MQNFVYVIFSRTFWRGGGSYFIQFSGEFETQMSFENYQFRIIISSIFGSCTLTLKILSPKLVIYFSVVIVYYCADISGMLQNTFHRHEVTININLDLSRKSGVPALSVGKQVVF